MVASIAIALMIVAAVAIVAWPYFNPAADVDRLPNGSDPALEHLVTQRDATYAAIKDLEFDHTMGKLSDGDYKGLRAKYEIKAVAILQELDGMKRAQPRSARSAESADSIEQQVQRLRRGAKCPQCGAPHAANDVFCAKCGTALRGIRCPKCGTRAAIGDMFCAGCGAVLVK
jgi:hypothetical protein